MATTAQHALVRRGLHYDLWCTSGTRQELANHIRQHLIRTRGAWVARFTMADILDCLSDGAPCPDHPGRMHYRFDDGGLALLE